MSDSHPWGLAPTTPVHCADCKFWNDTGINTAECRRRAPSTFPIPHPQRRMSFITKYPITKNTDWCGEGVKR